MTIRVSLQKRVGLLLWKQEIRWITAVEAGDPLLLSGRKGMA